VGMDPECFEFVMEYLGQRGVNYQKTEE
jgi:hypothetical protein